jgi:hypothetical protein
MGTGEDLGPLALSWLNAERTAKLLIDDQLTVEWANTVAREWLDARRPIAMMAGYLCMGPCTQELRDLLERARSKPDGTCIPIPVVHVTQFLRCNHPGRYTIRLGESTRVQWMGSAASYKREQRSLELGFAEFNIAPGAGTEETFVIVPKNPAAARDFARNLSTQIRLQ